ncbi:MAG TPA: L-2-hydroxyglutarate oxidase [Gaiellaceae bacterium]|jgi:L-2-hydroxyglutarate oxidase LhgO|nr:L-2-hydroxyglutarate oxidase [Gaiellaceae bacterium]
MSEVREELDAIVVGGGILGLATARQLLLDNPSRRITVFEKETRLAAHQTGHNSGVLHSGVYYKPGSLKAELCVSGKRLMEEFADQHDIPWRRRGKLIVAVDEDELPRLAELERRARENGVGELRTVEGHELADIEPHVTGLRALHVPATGVIDFRAVAEALADEVRSRGGNVALGHEVARIEPRAGHALVHSDDGARRARTVIACCGLQADRVAGGPARAGAAIVPFRGDYYTLRPRAAALVRGLIYPVPDPAFPFLGVHLTRHVDDTVAAGPNAVLSLAREGYRRTSMTPRDTLATLSLPGFWKFARQHARTGVGELLRDLSATAYLRALQRYVPAIEAADLAFGPSGIRAQALTRSGRLVDDFLIKRDDRVIHVINAPSPAATSALAIARRLAALAA